MLFPNENWHGQNKIAVITGGNAGIGYATANALASYQVEVHILCRHKGRGQKAVEAIRANHPDALLQLHIVDMSHREEVVHWAQNKAPRNIDILVNNAGSMPLKLTRTPSGGELIWETHVVGHYLLTSQLVEKKYLSKGARVITVSSGGMYLKQLDLEDLACQRRPYQKYKTYANAKRAQVILTELWHELYGPDIRFSSMHPGWVATKGVAHSMPWFNRILGSLLRTPEQGADTIVWLSLTEQDYPGGKLWFDRSITEPHRYNWTQESPQVRKKLLKVLRENTS